MIRTQFQVEPTVNIAIPIIVGFRIEYRFRFGLGQVLKSGPDSKLI